MAWKGAKSQSSGKKSRFASAEGPVPKKISIFVFDFFQIYSIV
jgi:hypothetical protein